MSPHRTRALPGTRMPTSKCALLSHRTRTRSRVAPADPCPSEHSSDACPATRICTSRCAHLPPRTCARNRTAPASTRLSVFSSSARWASSRSSTARRTSSISSSAVTASPGASTACAARSPRQTTPYSSSTSGPSAASSPPARFARESAAWSACPSSTPRARTARSRRSEYTSAASAVAHRPESGRVAFICTSRHSTYAEHADAAPVSIALNSTPATTQRVYCYAVASRAAQVQKNYGLLHIATSEENLYVAHAPLATSSRATAHVQQVKERVIKCTRSRTLASRADEQIPGTVRITSPTALNCTRPERDMLFTSLAPPTHGELVPISARTLTPTLLADWQHLHRAVIAHSCEADTRTRSNIRSCTPLNHAPLYIKCSSQHSPSFSRCHASSKVFFATRRLFPKAMSTDAEERLFNGASIGAVRVYNATLSRL